MYCTPYLQKNQNKYGRFSHETSFRSRSSLVESHAPNKNLGVGISLPSEIKSKILTQSVISQGKSMPMQERDKLRQGAGRGR